jgi:hypothetical protein
MKVACNKYIEDEVESLNANNDIIKRTLDKIKSKYNDSSPKYMTDRLQRLAENLAAKRKLFDNARRTFDKPLNNTKLIHSNNEVIGYQNIDLNNNVVSENLAAKRKLFEDTKRTFDKFSNKRNIGYQNLDLNNNVIKDGDSGKSKYKEIDNTMIRKGKME